MLLKRTSKLFYVSSPAAKVSALRTGFTLVEMLVATGLVVLIMSMFAQIYGTTVNTMTLQRGMANNDQKARSVQRLLTEDLAARSYREITNAKGHSKGIVPMIDDAPEAERELIFDPSRQRGYFYISENDPGDDSDDVLQFTTDLNNLSNRSEANVYLGKARRYSLPVPAVLSSPSREPDDDDGVAGNELTQSRYAEVSYFLRGGNLYRRLLLLRDPGIGVLPAAEQPRNDSGNRIYGTGAGEASDYTPSGSGNVFWSEFDVSATRRFDFAENLSYLWFNSIYSLDNASAVTPALGLPWNRFGHYSNWDGAIDIDSLPNSAVHGSPREYLDSSNPQTFVGRFTAGETSSTGMKWPGTTGVEFSRTAVTTPLTTNGEISGYDGGTRISEDLLLSNVEAFNIEVWDDANVDSTLHRFRSMPRGGAANNTPWVVRNKTYGPHTTPDNNNVFDTWHIKSFSNDGGSKNILPPRYLRYSDVYNLTLLNNWGELDPTYPINSPLPLGTAIRVPGHQYGSIVYMVVKEGVRGSTMPTFTGEIGDLVYEDNDPVNGAGWKCIDNRIGLKSIRITIRFRDVGKDLPRQVTVVHSFVE